MPTLTDYLDAGALQRLQDTFTAVAQAPVRICDAQGQPLTAAPSVFEPRKLPEMTRRAKQIEKLTATRPLQGVPVFIEETLAGQIVMEGGTTSDVERTWLLNLMAAMVGGLYGREKQLRSRVDHLATLYRLTSEFSGQRDLQSVLDIVARTVVEVMKAKGSIIRLLTDDRRELVIKAVHNVSPEYLSKGPVLLNDSVIDREAFDTGKPVYVADERTDPRVLYPAQVAKEGIVSALVAPMSYKGRAEGTLRVYMGERHEFDSFEVSLLEAISAQAAAALVNARLHEEAVRAADMDHQLRLAADVQRQMIPYDPPVLPGFQFAAVYEPCFELGGDFYDFVDLPPDNVGLAICDVSGKGVRASLLMASIRASLRAHASNIYDMSEVLTRVNRDLCRDRLTSDFATLFYGVLNYKTRCLTYANAGHPPPLLLRKGQIVPLGTGGGLIGLEESMQWPQELVMLQKGDVVLAYTDGLNEAMNFEDEAFGLERVEKALLAGAGAYDNAQAILKHILWEMRRFTGLQTPGDDLTMVAIKVL